MLDIKFTAVVCYAILISGASFSGILNFEWYNYEYGIKIFTLSVLMFEPHTSIPYWTGWKL